MTNSQLRKAAKLIVLENKLDLKTAKYMVNKLTKAEIKSFLKYLKLEYEKHTVRVITSTDLPELLKKQLEEKYLNKKVIFKIDKNQKEGICVITNDTIINLTLDGYLAQTVDILKQT